MTEQEAIEQLKNMFPKKCEMVKGRLKGGFDDLESDGGKAILLAISALEEIQQYRALGTVEELREVREKQIAKKPIRHTETIYDTRFEYFFCGKCYQEKKVVSIQRFCKYCFECGNGIDWSEIR